MTADSKPETGTHPSLDDLVDQLIGADVGAPEMKAQIRDMLHPTFEVFSGAKSGVSYLVETSGVDEQSVTKVLVSLKDMPLPNAARDWMTLVGFDRDDFSQVDIGFKRVTEGIVMQHCGMLNRDGQKPCEPETSS
ncbi:MAG: hypothetical protein ACR2RF_29560 [Geminicoccaceae bacterium]